VSAAAGLSSDRFALFSEARERFGRSLSQATVKLAPALSQVLSRQAERAIDLKARVELQESLHELNKQRDALPSLVMQRFNELVFKRLEIESLDNSSDVASGLLALMPEAELEEQVYANDLAQRIRAAGGQEYAALVTRIHALTQFSASEDRSPFSAPIIAAAFVMSLRIITRDRIAWATIRPELAEDLPQDIAEAMADVNDYLRQAAVVPELPRFVAKIELPEKPVAKAAAYMQEPKRELTPNQAANPTATEAAKSIESSQPRSGLIARAIASVDQAAGSGSQTGRNFLHSAQSMHQRALDSQRMLSVETLDREGASFASSNSVAPYSAAAREKFFGLLRDGLKAQREGMNRDAQMAIVDVVHSLFDYALDEQRVPEAAKPLMWRLQLPTVVLALLDPRYLGDQTSSIRRLIENLAAIIMAFPDDIFKGSELYARLESAVRAVEIVAHTLQTRTAVMAGLIEKQFSESANGVAMIAQRVRAQRVSLESMPGRRNRRDYRARPSREAEVAITQKLNLAIESRLAGRSVPPAVSQFLRDVWLRRLRSAALRDGEESKDFQVAMQIVDDLLLSVEDKSKRRERRELSVQIPPLIHQLTTGVKAVGVDEKDLASFFDELFLVHLRRMQRPEPLVTVVAPVAANATGRTIEPAAARPSQEMSIVQAMRRPQAADLASTRPDAVIPAAPISEPIVDVDWPVLTEDQRLDLPSNEDSFTPSIPSLEDLVPDKRSVDSKASSIIETSSRGTRAQRLKPIPSAIEPMRIQGMDQLANAASIKLVTQPLVWPKSIDQLDEDANRPVESAQQPVAGGSALSRRVANLPSDLDLMPKTLKTPALTLPKLNSNTQESLVNLLSSVDVTEGHEGFLREEFNASEAVDALAPGVWVELVSSSQGSRFAKVAWLNPQRSLVLLVREKDRKALSLRISEMLVRFGQRRAFVLRAPMRTPQRGPR
jgi:hypothetical protein